MMGMLIFKVTPSGSYCPHSEEAEPTSEPGDEPGPWSQLLNREIQAKIQSFFSAKRSKRVKPQKSSPTLLFFIKNNHKQISY